ncbi:hypothetical protein CUJ84_Chr002072 [Rhizobium leguminosarum]|uniref:Uncharacterized protein n=1 Tax=Rhizobium leguminosarum TaxID=384 RepID=A0A2K9Z2H6_RHILE|nr:hypothetical protein CUJ84_Chr002072 [Rhizobium leguminosarum]
MMAKGYLIAQAAVTDPEAKALRAGAADAGFILIEGAD